MKTKIFTFFSALFFMCFSSQAVVWPTKVVAVAPDPGTTIGALQNAITANGSAIYVLKRGGTYFTNGQYTIPAEAGTLIIRAEDGTGPRPIIMGGVPSSGYPSSSNVIRVASDIKFENIYFTGEDMNGVVHKNTIRLNSGTWFEFVGCMFDKDNAASIRNESQNCVYIFNNCTFRNQVDYAGVANGRGFDARDAKAHLSLVMKNCTFYNMSARVIRPSTSEFDSIVFVNNTVYNVMEALSLGRALKVVCNNNIFYNCGLNGATLKTAGMIEIDSIATAADATRTFDLRNNLFYTDPQYQTVMVAPTGTTRYQRNILNNAAKFFLKNKQVVISDTIKNQSIVFTNPAPLVVGYVQYMWQNGWPASFTPTANQRIEVMEDPLNYGDVVAPKVPYKFGYPTTSPVYTAGLKGDIMGDKKWFGKITGIERLEVTLGREATVYFDYLTEKLNVRLYSDNVSSFTLRIYSIEGKQIANRLIQNLGQKQTQMEIKELPRGIYVYQIEGNLTNGSKNFSGGKLIF
jgi:hypothetical protein